MQIRSKKALSLPMAVLPVIGMLVFLGGGYAGLGLRAEPMILLATALAVVVAFAHGYSWNEILDAIVERLRQAMPAILILVSVGFLIGSWVIGGTVPMMVYLGLKHLDPSWFYVSAFLLNAFVSTCIGTSWGSAGTVGVALMGVAIGLNLPLSITAGAIVSGAFFGDKLSPLSDTTNLASIASGAPLYQHIAHMLWTTGAGFVICLVVYTFLGLNLDLGQIPVPERIEAVTASLEQVFVFNFWVLLPPVVVLIGSMMRLPTIPIMFSVSALAMFNAWFFQGFNLTEISNTVIEGFDLKMISDPSLAAVFPADAARLLEVGGMKSMMNTLVICFCSFAFAGAMTVTGALNLMIDRLLCGIKTVFGLISSTLAAAMLVSIITANGQLAILLIGDMFRERFKQFNLAPTNLSRTVEDAGTGVEPLLPWSAAGVYMTSVLGVSPADYLPWACINYTGIIFALIWGFTGIGIAHLRPKTA